MIYERCTLRICAKVVMTSNLNNKILLPKLNGLEECVKVVRCTYTNTITPPNRCQKHAEEVRAPSPRLSVSFIKRKL
jgi:hypothetical protein